MKKSISVIIFILLFNIKAKSQSLIIKTNNDSIKVEIVEEKNKSYLCLRLEKPKLYISIKKSDIKSILPLFKDTIEKVNSLYKTVNETESIENLNNINSNSGEYLFSAGNNLILANTLSIIGTGLLVLNLSSPKPLTQLTVTSIVLQLVSVVLDFNAAFNLKNAGYYLKLEQQRLINKEKPKP